MRPLQPAAPDLQCVLLLLLSLPLLQTQSSGVTTSFYAALLVLTLSLPLPLCADADQRQNQRTTACVTCRKARSACTGGLPCQRCVRRGIGDECAVPERLRPSKAAKAARGKAPKAGKAAAAKGGAGGLKRPRGGAVGGPPAAHEAAQRDANTRALHLADLMRTHGGDAVGGGAAVAALGGAVYPAQGGSLFGAGGVQGGYGGGGGVAQSAALYSSGSDGGSQNAPATAYVHGGALYGGAPSAVQSAVLYSSGSDGGGGGGGGSASGQRRQPAPAYASAPVVEAFAGAQARPVLQPAVSHVDVPQAGADDGPSWMEPLLLGLDSAVVAIPTEGARDAQHLNGAMPALGGVAPVATAASKRWVKNADGMFEPVLPESVVHNASDWIYPFPGQFMSLRWAGPDFGLVRRIALCEIPVTPVALQKAFRDILLQQLSSEVARNSRDLMKLTTSLDGEYGLLMHAELPALNERFSWHVAFGSDSVGRTITQMRPASEQLAGTDSTAVCGKALIDIICEEESPGCASLYLLSAPLGNFLGLPVVLRATLLRAINATVAAQAQSAAVIEAEAAAAQPALQLQQMQQIQLQQMQQMLRMQQQQQQQQQQRQMQFSVQPQQYPLPQHQPHHPQQQQQQQQPYPAAAQPRACGGAGSE